MMGLRPSDLWSASQISIINKAFPKIPYFIVAQSYLILVPYRTTTPAMPANHTLRSVPLTPSRQLTTLVENRRIFNLKNCELNVFESYERTFDVPLTFGDLVITSMVRGKKIMHLEGRPAFDYLPGETVLVRANETMVIDFPDAAPDTPTQCIALAVDNNYITNTLHYLNEYYNSAEDSKNDWTIHFDQYHFNNDTDLSGILDKLIRICTGDEGAKNIYADLSLKELLIRILQSQHLQLQSDGASKNSNSSRLHFILQYIREHLTERIPVDTLSQKAYLSRNIFFKWFREQFGLTPGEYITRERIRLARQLLAEEKHTLGEVSAQCGFNDLNYFVRAFKKSEGLTPGAYRAKITRSSDY
jgi:AraC-like DNA-binding protein